MLVHKLRYTNSGTNFKLTHTITQTRYNKFLKELVRNGRNTSTVLANAFAIDTAASYIKLCVSTKKYRIEKAFHHIYVLEQKVCGSGVSKVIGRIPHRKIHVTLSGTPWTDTGFPQGDRRPADERT